MPRCLPSLLCLVLVPAAARTEDIFRERIAPLLEKHCTSCHGGAAPRGGLSLVDAQSLRASEVIVNGKPTESRLIEMVSGEKPKMPQGGPPLSAPEREALAAWIAEGAPWPEGVVVRHVPPAERWWSFQPIRTPPVPIPKIAGWARTPIDAFILDGLERRGLAPNAEADRQTLIRRLSFDLLGLPPSPEEVEHFLADDSLDAYERLVDRLLASPHYGERWGRHWLDVVHYGDTHGYDKDKRRPNAWPYRDYVIRSLNEDKPYARFLQEQIAGDVLSPDDPEGRIAVGFIAAGPWDFVGHVELREGTVEKAKTRVLDRDDMVCSTIGTFMSLTIGCARCHDHKFDPITQTDYYRLQAVFAGVERGDRPLPDPSTDAARARLVVQQRRLLDEQQAAQNKLNEVTLPAVADLDRRLAQWKDALKKLTPQAPAGASPTNGYHSAIMPMADVVKWVQVDLGKPTPIEEIRLIPARPTDFPDTPGFGFPVRFSVAVSEAPDFEQAEVVADHSQADFPNPKDEPVIVAVMGKRARYIRVTVHRLWLRTNDYVFALAELQAIADGKNHAAGAAVQALDSIEAGRWSTRHLVDGFNSRTPLPAIEQANVLTERRRLREQIEQGAYERAKQIIEATPPELKARLESVAAQLAEIERQLKEMPQSPEVYTVKPTPPRQIHVLRRGEVEQPRNEVNPGRIAVLSGAVAAEFSLGAPMNEGARRAALAEWLADADNPLTWRSIVNRVWHYHFGRGIVDTPNDFGKNGSQPSHPELLDWLAANFRDQGGSLKQLHRLVVTSSVYRQSSRVDPEALRKDADNRWLGRMNRQRLDAEALRDAVLFASGRLDRRIGGPGYDLFRFRDDHSPEYDHTALEKIHDPQTYRRTVYRFVVRSVPNPFLDCLDCADPNVNTPVRNTTLTALQALALLNDPFMVRQAELLAERIGKEVPSPAAQIDRAFLLTLGRPPRAGEREALLGHLTKHGLRSVCRVLFNSNEFVFVD